MMFLTLASKTVGRACPRNLGRFWCLFYLYAHSRGKPSVVTALARL
jgi:hypothetical protein